MSVFDSIRTWRDRQRCRRWDEALHLTALGVADPAAVSALEKHTERCPACRTRLAELRRLTQEVQALLPAETVVRPPARLRQTWQDAVRADRGRIPTSTASRDPAGFRSSSTASEGDRERRTVPAWSGLRWAWGSLAACWLAVAWFRGAGPSVERRSEAPVRTALTIRELRLALGNGSASAAEKVAESASTTKSRGTTGTAPRSEGRRYGARA